MIPALVTPELSLNSKQHLVRQRKTRAGHSRFKNKNKNKNSGICKNRDLGTHTYLEACMQSNTAGAHTQRMRLERQAETRSRRASVSSGLGSGEKIN